MKHLLDITKDHCPITLVKVKLEMSKIADGDRLDVLILDGEALRNVPRTLVEQGHKIIEQKLESENIHRLTVEKHGHV